MMNKTKTHCSGCTHNGWCKYQNTINDIKEVIDNAVDLDESQLPFYITIYCEGYRDHDI